MEASLKTLSKVDRKREDVKNMVLKDSDSQWISEAIVEFLKVSAQSRLSPFSTDLHFSCFSIDIDHRDLSTSIL